MNVWLRLLMFVRPHWRSLALSVGCGLAAAALWGASLLMTFPVIKVFLEGRHLAQYVRTEFESAERQLALYQAESAELTAQLQAIESTGAADAARRRELLSRHASVQRRINTYSSKLYGLSWVQGWVIPRLPDDPFRLLLLVFAVMLLATALKGAMTVGQDVLVHRASELVIIDLRNAMYRRLLKLDPQGVAAGGTPQWLAAFTNELQMLSYGMSLMGGEVVREPLKAFACISAAFMLNWKLTCCTLIFVPVAGFMFHVISRRLKRAIGRSLDSMTRIYQVLEETFSSVHVVTAFDRARLHRQRFHRENRVYLSKALRIVHLDALTGPATEVLGTLAVLAALLPCAYLVLNGRTNIAGISLAESPMDIAELSVLYALLAGTLDPVRKFSKLFTRIKSTSTSAERIFAVMDRQPAVASPAQAKHLPGLRHQLELRQVTFDYATTAAEGDRQRPHALDDVSLTIAAGETIALVGTNGSGKSTLVNLLPRFQDPQAGSILVDGVDLRDVRLRDLRRHIAIVNQEPILFEGTIFENIRYGRPEATPAEVRQAAARAHVTDFADTFPEGLDTPLAGQGRGLSGGQRQRVALARAIVRDPALLILDEPTSAVDAQSEQLIQQSLQDFAKGRTTVLITHALSPSLLEFIDRIAVLDRGRLVAVGTHADLLETCPVYQHLFQHAPLKKAG